MNTNTSTLLTKVQFTPATVVFRDGQLSGFLDVADDVRETYINNTVESADVRETMRQAARAMPTGEVIVSSVARSNRFDAGVEIIRLVSMHGDAPAGELEMAVRLSATGQNEMSFEVQPLYMSVASKFAGQGHTLDLISAACWLVQDMVAELSGDVSGANLTLGVTVNPELDGVLNQHFVKALALTLEVTGNALFANAANDESAAFLEAA